MDEEREKIMNMLAEGTITVEEAYQLLDAIEADQPAAPSRATGRTERIEPQPRSEADSQAGNIFANLTLDQLIQLRMHGVSPEFIRGVRAAGLKDLSFEQILELGIHRVDAEFIRGIYALGLTDLSFEQILELGIHHIDPEFIRGIYELGLTDLSFEQLRDLGIFRV